MNLAQVVSWVLPAVLVFWAVGAYNRLMRLRNRIGDAFQQIDGQLKRRHELLSKLLETAQPHVGHERETLEAVRAASEQAGTAAEQARARPTDARALGALRIAEQVLAAALERLMALAENYPELKTDEALRALAEEITGTEGRLAFACQAFDESVLDYNAAAQQFPTRLISAVFGFRVAGRLQAPASEAERAGMRALF